MRKLFRSRRRRVLAVASRGGHWVQLLRLLPAFDNCNVVYVSTDEGYRDQVDGAPFRTLPDASRWNKLAMMRLALCVAWLVIRYRPMVVISTGAAPGFFAVVFGKVLGARTIWLDSIANAEKMSLSGEKAKPFADLWMTQWPQVAARSGASYSGAIL
ncbi:MAG: UDP-N-acetylglucosamine--LPS N-acetylglucosamine transferase [Planctomycetota bacterium]